jgi:hypothetical protein
MARVPSVVMLIVVILSVECYIAILSVIMVSVIVLSGIILSVIILSVVAPVG